MNRLYTFLIISLLLSQSIWAFHDIEFNHPQDQAYSQISDKNDVNGNYDHCGHASAHLVGLLSNSTFEIFIAPKSNLFAEQNTTSSITYQPPVPPPTS